MEILFMIDCIIIAISTYMIFDARVIARKYFPIGSKNGMVFLIKTIGILTLALSILFLKYVYVI